MSESFFKYHALGNDYIVIDPTKCSIKMTPANIIKICHRNFGVGSDGILYGPFWERGSAMVKIYNPDGGEAEKSGNGARIFSRYLIDQNYVYDQRFTLKTLGGPVEVEVVKRGQSLLKINMGTVTFISNEIPVNGAVREVINESIDIDGQLYTMSCVSIGNPHCIIILPEVSPELAVKLGPSVERHELFPNRINMQIMKILDRNNIQIEIWERGAGYTLASGSSSCAAASTAFKLGLTDRNMTVHMPGGQIEIEIAESGHVFMTGTVSSVASGEFSPEFLASLDK